MKVSLAKCVGERIIIELRSGTQLIGKVWTVLDTVLWIGDGTQGEANVVAIDAIAYFRFVNP